MGRILVKDRQFMTLASGGAMRASRPLPTRPAPERRIGLLPSTPLWTNEGWPAYLADRPSYCLPWRQSSGGLSVKAMVSVKISSLMMKAIGEDDRDEHGQAHEEQCERPLLDVKGRELVVLARPGICYGYVTPAHL